ncbi:MAG: hypothetical protein EP330_02760 [Deltaproteobacteria bacterium]|nr:MAG: hypothetical protein EP330_02760 [Deltaproteobacteria bacterium]
MRRSVHALALGFAGYGALVLGILALAAVGVGVLGATGAVPLSEVLLANGIMLLVGLGFGGPFLGTAWALHRRRAWARVPALVLAVLVVGNAPLGTLLGGYTLYTLLDDEGTAQLDS